MVNDLQVYGGSHPVERVTRGRLIIDSNHAQVHAGNAFHLSFEFEGLAAGGVIDATIDVGEADYVHFQNFQATLELAFDVQIIEGDTPTTGSLYNVHNRNRLRAATGTNLVVHDEPVTVNLTELMFKHFPASLQGGSGVITEGTEWVLAHNKSYTFRLRNEGVQPANGFMSLDWYEETGA